MVRRLVTQPPGSHFEIEYRLCRQDGTVRRVRHRGFPVPGSDRAVWIVSDVTAEREAAERQILLAREVDHRAKNALAVVQSMVLLTPAVILLSTQGRETILDVELQRVLFTLGAAVFATAVLAVGHRLLPAGNRASRAPR